ncbi:MAG: TrkH family potassium uptake protein [Gammaproteobacteria bacterium]|nr:TrkH family potassium uptake protein [Gammaproteobacteria bacterium]
MHIKMIQQIIGLLLMLFSTSMLPPIVMDLFFSEDALNSFLLSYVILIITGLLFWYPVRKNKKELKIRDGFVVVVMFWSVLGISGALPFIFYQPLQISMTDAVFESVSALTTTGATVITSLDTLPHALLFYRQQLQWMGGMGIIVLAVAILPMLGIGGMQLYRAETPGPVKDSKLTPRITETAKALWYIYLWLTISCALAYWAAGMNWFDAIGHSFSTVAIGGFSTHDASLGYFDSPLIEAVAIVFMFLGGINFALHFLAFKRRSFIPFLADAEFKTYALVLLLSVVIAVLFLFFSQTVDTFSVAFRQGVFQAVSIGTTTGFTTTGYFLWPVFLPVFLLFISFIGGCSGSTGGGMKVIRVLLLFKQGARELVKLVHPNAQVVVKIGKQPMSDRVIDAVWGFFAAYVALFVLMMLLLMMAGNDQVTAFSAVAATMNNLGPGLGEVGANYSSINDFSKWVLCFAMLLGRLEVFTLLVLFTPVFWRR